jgi:hypothetical protein
MLTNYVPDPLAVGPQLLLAATGATVTKAADTVLSARGRSYRVTSTSAEPGTAALPTEFRAPAAAGERWHGGARVRFDPDLVGTQTISLRVSFYDGGGTFISSETAETSLDLATGFYETSAGSELFVPVGPTMNDDRSYDAGYFQPAGDDYYELTAGDVPLVPYPVDLRVTADAPDGTAAATLVLAGNAFYASQLQLVKSAKGERPQFFTGSSGRFFDWMATPNASASVYYETAPELVPVLDRAPVERVEVTFVDVLPAAQYVNVYRIADGRTMQVRGGLRRLAVGGFGMVDYEAPFGVPITYRAEMFTDASMTVSLGFTEPGETQLDATEPCLHQPLNPTAAVWPLVLLETATDLVRRSPGEMVYAEGAEVGTWFGGQRRGLEDVQFDMLTDTISDADRFQAMLGRYGESNVAVLCVRTPPPMRIPRTLFATVDELHEVGVDTHLGGEAVRFQFSSAETLPPAPGLVPALLRRDDIDAAYPTRNERAAAYLNRRDRDRDFSLAGLAG